MKSATPDENAARPAVQVCELFFDNTSSQPQLLAVYEGPDTPRPAASIRGTRVTRLNKSGCAVTLSLLCIKARETRGEFSAHSGESRKDILKTLEPKSWPHTLADTYARGGNGELEKLFSDNILKTIGVRGGRLAYTRIDKETGKLASPICLDSRINGQFPANLRILANERAGGPFAAIHDERKLMELAEKLEDTRGFWETHLFPLNLDSLEARAAGQAGGRGSNHHAFSFHARTRTNRPAVKPRQWRERGEPADFPELKFRFLKLIRAGQDDECIDMIENHPALVKAKFPPNRDCALTLAITYERNRVIYYLLDRPDVDRDAANEHGVTPLLKAAFTNNLGLIKALVEQKDQKKVNCQVVNYMGANVIYEAAFGGGHEAYHIIEYFHDNCKVPCDRQTHDGFLPLTLAAWRKCDERTTRYLIENTGDLNVADFYGETAYFKAVKNGNVEAVNLLFDLGGDKLDRTKTPSRHLTDRASELFRAVHYGSLKLVKDHLREGNQDIDEAELEFERSPLHEAVDRGHPQIVEELIARGANVFIQNHHGRIPRDFLPWKRTVIFNEIEDILKQAEEEWIDREMSKLPGLKSTI